MSSVGRNQPCPCGSGRKAKRCCGVQRGPSERDLAQAALAHHALNAARTLAHVSDHRVLELVRELDDLPERDLTLLVELPAFVSPELGRLYRAIAAVADLQAAGRLDPLLAAAAHIDLGSRSQFLIRASLIQAATTAAGVTRTPGGLLLAA